MNNEYQQTKTMVVLFCFLGVARIIYFLLSKPGASLAVSEVALAQVDPEDTTQEQVRGIVHRWTELSHEIAHNMSNPQLPSPNEPFVFFHVRKGGGSSIRTLLYTSSQKYNLDYWIPCSNGHKTPCVPFTLPWYDQKKPRKAVYASHLNWSMMSQFMRETIHDNRVRKNKLIPTTKRTFKIEDHEKERTDLYQSLQVDDGLRAFGSCLTNIRPTVSRVKSCWNFRFVQSKDKRWEIPDASNATIEEWKILLPDAVDHFGNGCNNEMYRIFGSTQHEKFVNQLSIETYGLTHYLDELETVLDRMAKCVMIRIDRCADSITILRHYLPWINAEDLCGRHEKKSPLPTNITNEVSEFILAQNAFDELVFTFGAELFDAQLKVAQKEGL